MVLSNPTQPGQTEASSAPLWVSLPRRLSGSGTSPAKTSCVTDSRSSLHPVLSWHPLSYTVDKLFWGQAIQDSLERPNHETNGLWLNNTTQYCLLLVLFMIDWSSRLWTCKREALGGKANTRTDTLFIILVTWKKSDSDHCNIAHLKITPPWTPVEGLPWDSDSPRVRVHVSTSHYELSTYYEPGNLLGI